MKRLLVFIPFLLFFACEEKKELKAEVPYDGPILSTENINVIFSDSGKTKVKMNTALELRYENQDINYPKTVYINFINTDGVEYSSLRGDSAKYIKQTNIFTLTGNVFFFNREKLQSLETEELFWDPSKGIIYSNKKVNINTPTEQIQGIAMRATQDFSTYTIKKITGIFQVDSLITQPRVTTPSD